MVKNRILLVTEILLIVIVTFAMVFAILWIEPVSPLSHVLKTIFPLLLITYFFFFLVFRLIGFYYHQLLHQKKLVEDLNAAFMKLSAKLNTDSILKQSLEILMDFCRGTTGVMLVLDEKLREYASGEMLTLNINTAVVDNYGELDEKNSGF